VTLWVLIILTIMVGSYALTVRTNTHVAANFADELRAYGLARAGLEITLAELTENANVFTGFDEDWAEHTSDADELQFLDGTYRVRVFDEAAKLDVNLATEEQLSLLLEDDELVAAIMDWIDDDDETRPDGCESFYYESLDPRYIARNGPMVTTGELGLTRDMELERLWGDPALFGVPRRIDEQRGLMDLLTTMSVDSDLNAEGEDRININEAEAQELTTALSEQLTEVQIQAIVDYRNEFEGDREGGEGEGGGPEGGPPGFGGPGMGGMGAGGVPPSDALFEGGFGSSGPPGVDFGGSSGGGVGTRQFEGGPPGDTFGGMGGVGDLGGMGDFGQPPPDELFGGPEEEAGPEEAGEGEEEQSVPFENLGDLLTVEEITSEDLGNIGDLVTTGSDGIYYGRVNINTAPAEVLALLPGLDDALADEIVEWRQGQSPFENIGQLLQITSIDEEIFAELADSITARSYLYTIEALGHVPGSGVVKLVRCTVDVSGQQPNILLYMER